jgi:hypothetical protein
MPAAATSTVMQQNQPLKTKPVPDQPKVQAEQPLGDLPSIGGSSGLPTLGGLPSLGGGLGGGRRPFGGLGGVHGRAGGFDVDMGMKAQADRDLAKLRGLDGGFGDINIEEEKKEEPADSRTMLQVMQDKRKAAEASNAAAKASQPQPAGETVEERKARMIA